MGVREGIAVTGLAILFIFFGLTVAPEAARGAVTTAGAIGILLGLAMVLLE